MTASKLVDRLISGAFAIAALAMAAVFVGRELRGPETRLPQRVEDTNQYLRGWEQEIASGINVGPEDAPVSIIEFTDFECPFCRLFAPKLDSLLAEFSDQVRVVFHHLPLPMHRFAQVTAVAAECAAGRGMFKEFHDLVFAKQDSIGLKSWASFASDLGIDDPVAFESCVKENRSFPRIDYGVELASRAGVRATPTIVVNGWWLGRTPNLDDLREAVRAVLSGRDPASGDTVDILPAQSPFESISR